MWEPYRPNVSHSHVLHHNVTVWNQPVHPVMSALPPVLRGSQVEQQRGSLLEGQLSRSAANVVKLCDGLDLLQLWNTKTQESTTQRNVTESSLRLLQLLKVRLVSLQCDSPSSLVLGPVPLSTSSRAPGSLWGLSLNGEIWRQRSLKSYSM